MLVRKISLTVLTATVLVSFSLSYAASTDKVSEQELTKEQKKELAKQVGIILPGMTKQEVKETLGEPRKTGFSASTSQEVWYYKAPEEQNVYFKDDKVERVEYIPKKQTKPKLIRKESEEI